MNAETIREWLIRRPFEPFELRLSNGEHYQVRHPEATRPRQEPNGHRRSRTDRFVHVALVHVNSIEALQTA